MTDKIFAKVEVALQRKSTINISSQEDAAIEVFQNNPDEVSMKVETKDSHAIGRVYTTLSKENARLLLVALAEKLGLVVMENAATIAAELKK